MEKFLTVLKVTSTLIILIAITLFIVVFNASGKAENNYQNVIKDIDSGNWMEAFSAVQEVPNYKDASQLYSYIYPHTFFYEKYNTNTDAISGYQRGIALINEVKTQIKGKDSSKYAADLKELNKVFNFKIAELNAVEQNKAMAKTLSDSVALINKKDYANALTKLNTIADISQYGTEKKQLINYINLLNAITAKDQNTIMQTIAMLNPGYKGDLSSQIQAGVKAYVSLNQWNTMYNNYIQQQNQNQIQTQAQGQKQTQGKNPPQGQQPDANITEGMTRDTVVQYLGNPVTDNKISDSYGNFEEMTYSNRTIFLENNTVVVEET